MSKVNQADYTPLSDSLVELPTTRLPSYVHPL